MTSALPVLLLASAGVGFGHAVLPDHWVPLAVVARTRKYSLRRVVRQALAASAAHVVISLVLGAVLITVGLQFRGLIQSRQGIVVGGVLVLTGVALLVLELVGRVHGHPHPHSHADERAPRDHDHEHDHDHDHEGEHYQGHEHAPHGLVSYGHSHDHGRASAEHSHAPRRDRGALLALVVPFGAAASPDITALPVFLAASALGFGAAVGSLLVFALATIATITGLTLVSTLGARLFTAPWIDRGANLLTAVVLLVIGGFVASGRL
jgi:ABC-type nickel/cobalt efflux system permease component RcnA